jgi:nitronate monooxygenase
MNRVEPAELVDFLNQLLEAERAGTRVARESRDQCITAPERQLMTDIHGDEARWCKMLIEAIPRWGGEPSLKVGDFHQRAMAIADLDERLRFLNRGQGWVAKRLGEMIPRVADAALRTELVAMRENHDANIARVNRFLDTRS